MAGFNCSFFNPDRTRDDGGVGCETVLVIEEVHSLVYGRRASGENGRKLTTSTRVGSESRLMDYLG